MLLNGALQSRAGKTLFGFNQTNCTELFGRPASRLPPGCSVVREVSVPNTGLGLTRHRRYSDALSGRPSGRQPAFRHRGRSLAEGSGCGWFSSGVCGEYARKLSGGQAFPLVTGLQPWTVNPSRKLRRFESLHLPATTRSGLNSAGSSRTFSAPTTSKVGAVVSALVNPQRREVQQLVRIALPGRPFRAARSGLKMGLGLWLPADVGVPWFV